MIGSWFLPGIMTRALRCEARTAEHHRVFLCQRRTSAESRESDAVAPRLCADGLPKSESKLPSGLFRNWMHWGEGWRRFWDLRVVRRLRTRTGAIARGHIAGRLPQCWLPTPRRDESEHGTET